MPSKPKTARRKHLDKTISVILILHNTRKSHSKIVNYVKIQKSKVTQIIQCVSKNLTIPFCKIKCVRQSTKLNARSQKTLLRHIERNPNNNLATLNTPIKSDHTLSQATIRSYLKAAGYLRFKAQIKHFLIQKHKDARLR